MSEPTPLSRRTYKTVFAAGEEVIKSFAPDYDRALIFNEALNQSYMERTELHVPSILKVAPDADGRWGIYSKRIKGDTLENLLKKYPEKEEEYLSLFVDTQLKMQSIDVPFLKAFATVVHGALDEGELRPTVRFGLLQEYLSFPKNRKIIHFDYSLSNVMLDEDGTPWILDWAHAVSGTGAADVMKTYIWFRLHDYDHLADRYLALFAERSNQSVDEILRWGPVVAAVLYPRAKANEKEFLLQMIMGR